MRCSRSCGTSRSRALGTATTPIASGTTFRAAGDTASPSFSPTRCARWFGRRASKWRTTSRQAGTTTRTSSRVVSRRAWADKAAALTLDGMGADPAEPADIHTARPPVVDFEPVALGPGAVVRQRGVEHRESLVDLARVPARAILVLERDEVARVVNENARLAIHSRRYGRIHAQEPPGRRQLRARERGRGPRGPVRAQAPGHRAPRAELLPLRPQLPRAVRTPASRAGGGLRRRRRLRPPPARR